MKNSLLFGNGINRLTQDSVSWDILLEQLKGNKKFKNGELPYTMIYERVLLERDKNKSFNINEVEYEIKREISKQLFEQKTNKFYSKLIDLNFDNYLTTNYENTFENTINNNYFFQNKNGAGFIEYNRTEKIYSIRRYSKFIWKERKTKLWKIHGEIANPKSIMIGLDHYGGYVSKINDYVKGNYRITKGKKNKRLKSIKEKIKSGKFDGISWVELFFNSNLHILGFGMDYSEIDLWWILNKRARLMSEIKINNTITFYSDKMNSEKKGLLKSLNVEVIEIEVLNNNYSEQYDKIINMIKR